MHNYIQPQPSLKYVCQQIKNQRQRWLTPTGTEQLIAGIDRIIQASLDFDEATEQIHNLITVNDLPEDGRERCEDLIAHYQSEVLLSRPSDTYTYLTAGRQAERVQLEKLRNELVEVLTSLDISAASTTVPMPIVADTSSSISSPSAPINQPS